MATTIVRVAKIRNYDVYIGRRFKMAGWDLPDSKWRSPFPFAVFGPLSVAQYEEYLLLNEGLMNALPELIGKRLGCWCRQGHCCCHGQVLARLANGISLPIVSSTPNPPGPPGDDVKSMDQ